MGCFHILLLQLELSVNEEGFQIVNYEVLGGLS